jgi:hypothetical protein
MKDFDCRICRAKVKNLYSVRLSIWVENIHNPEEMNQWMQSLSAKKQQIFYEDFKRKTAITRSFICPCCLHAFRKVNSQLCEFLSGKWRLAAPDFYNIKEGIHPAIYDKAKWEKYQNRQSKRVKKA